MLLLSCVVTFLLLAVGVAVCYCAKRQTVNDKFIKGFLTVLRTYHNCLHYEHNAASFLRITLLIGAVLLNILFVIDLCWLKIRDFEITGIKIAVIIGSSVSVLFIVLFLLAYLLMSINSMHQEGEQQKDQSVTLLVLGHYFIISLYSFVFLIYGSRAVSYYRVILSLLGIGQLLNLVAFIKIITPPEEAYQPKGQSNEKSSFGRSLFSSLLLMILAVSGMYLAVCYTEVCFPASYNQPVSFFDLLYYTAVTFCTIGYGDIAPVTFYARMVGMVIIISSPAYLVLLLGKVNSFK